MAKKDRSKELWHIPKRGSVHQTVYMVYCLTWDKFLNKSWSPGKQESMASEMGKAGLTNSGKALSHQSVRTLLANVPKYLGFVFIDDSSTPSRVNVTEVGYQLVEHHDIKNIKHYGSIKQYRDAGALIETSVIFRQQMEKLIITNPSILSDCVNILVFPFRMTLRLLLSLDYLDIEEIAYFVFHAKNEDEFDLLIEKINNFRALSPQRRQSEIDAYKKTNEGNLTLVQAPSAGYYMYLCVSTGVCKRSNKKVNKIDGKSLRALELVDSDLTSQLLAKFDGTEIYDFKDNYRLWIDYFSVPGRLFPPFDSYIKTSCEEDLLVTVSKDDLIIASGVISQNSDPMVFPSFPDEYYEIKAYSLFSGSAVFSSKVLCKFSNRFHIIHVDSLYQRKPVTRELITLMLSQMFNNSFRGFDQDYHDRLSALEKVLGLNYFDNYRKGGRLEYIFYDLLNLLKDKGSIDDVFWFGKIVKYGIFEPAPGGKEGYPDIVFEIENYSFVLELTTIKGVRAQWNSSEASSVPDHIKNYKKQHPGREVIGIFSAPSIHPQLEQNLLLNAKENNLGMIFIPCIEFAEQLFALNRDDLLKYLLSKVDKQLNS